jgi:small subunit ribosomal protein S11
MFKKKLNFNSTINVYKIYIKSTYNNIIITVSNTDKSTYFWASSGLAGFKGTRKSTPYAAQCATKMILSKLKDLNIHYINLILKGKGAARNIPIKILKNSGIKILSITDKSAIAFNGCRLPKKRKL